MKLSEIQIRDPFVLPIADRSTYYLFGTTDADPYTGGVGFDCYSSSDLIEWEGPTRAFRRPPGFWAKLQFWAPEVYAHKGRYFMLATFNPGKGYRGTQVLAANRPEGPYKPWSDGPVTPRHWQCLDGTLHIDASGQPWLVFCHEWCQIRNGSICAVRLSADLRRAEGQPIHLFNATDASWVRCLTDKENSEWLPPRWHFPAYVTDGPFLHRTASGALLMLWSSFSTKGYAMGIARSESGTVEGPWIQEKKPIWKEDGGHGMIFRAFDGRLFLTLHQPNNAPHERAAFYELEEHADSIRLKANGRAFVGQKKKRKPSSRK
jgi:arabinan endo-1,5-alpha-L-arabinosidase